LIEELNGFPEIKDTDQEFEFRLLNKEYKLAKPSIKERDAVYQLSTYSLDLYIPAQLAQKKKKKYKNKLYLLEVFL
jgi:DNA-directed RNA polymerase beta subunit